MYIHFNLSGLCGSLYFRFQELCVEKCSRCFLKVFKLFSIQFLKDRSTFQQKTSTLVQSFAQQLVVHLKKAKLISSQHLYSMQVLSNRTIRWNLLVYCNGFISQHLYSNTLVLQLFPIHRTGPRGEAQGRRPSGRSRSGGLTSGIKGNTSRFSTRVACKIRTNTRSPVGMLKL